MRIGFFTDGFLPQPNGVATSVFESARELEAREHEVFIIAPKYPGYIDRNLAVIRLPSFKVAEKPETRLGISLPNKHLRKILSLDFDIIHGHSGGPVTLLGWEIARAKKIPCVVTYHTLWNRYTHYILKGRIITPKMMEKATKILGNRMDFLIAPTERVERELRSYGVKRPIKVVPSGINIEKFKNAAPGVLRSKLVLKGGEPILLFVGRLGREKSVDFIIRSFKRVLDARRNAHLVIIGDGPERKKLELLSKKLKVNKNTHFLGEIESTLMHRMYKDATVFVFSSTTETQGLVVPEALASGVPIVAIDDPAYEIVKNGENGYLVKADEGEFASKIISIIQNKNLREKLSRAALESAQKISVKASVDLLESVYFGLLEKHNKQSVLRIMAEKEKGEAVFITWLAFWVTVLLTRFIIYFFHKSIFYPAFYISNQSFYHSAIGIFLVLLFLALLIKKRKAGILSLLLLGAGAGFVTDDLSSMIAGHVSIFDYFSPLNFLIILSVGLLPLILVRKKADERPKFYVGTPQSKHVNPARPKVSVVIPAYNEGKFIEPVLQSLLNQSYKEFELIVVDNNSEDNTGEIARSFGARVIKQKIKGVAAARQKGFLAARGAIIASTDADSIAPENWVKTIAEKYEKNPSLVGFGGLATLYSGPVTARAAGRYLFPLFWKLDKLFSKGWNMAGFNMSVRKSAFLKIGGFNSKLKIGEDIDLSEKLRRIGQVKIDTNFMVYASGRRYSKGLLSGLSVYAPWWISKVILRRAEPFSFPEVRSEKVEKRFNFLPLSLAILFLSLLFYFGNLEY